MVNTALPFESLIGLPRRCASLRGQLGIPQAELARWLGVSRSYLSHLEHGRQVPSRPVLKLFEQLEAHTRHSPLIMHEPAPTPPPSKPAVPLPPEALAALDQVFAAPAPTPPDSTAADTLTEPTPAAAAPTQPTLAERCKALRQQLGVTRPKLAEWMGVCRQYVTNIENGKKASLPVIKLLEKIEAEVREGRFQYQSKTPVKSEPPTPKAAPAPVAEKPALPAPTNPFPVNGLISAPPPPALPLTHPRLAAIPLLSMREASGLTSPANSSERAREHFAFAVADPQAFAIRVTGDAMQPQHTEGEIAILYPQAAAHTGDRVMARIRDGNGGEVLFRIFSSADSGRSVVLSSPNPVYPAITLLREDILWLCPVAATVRPLIR